MSVLLVAVLYLISAGAAAGAIILLFGIYRRIELGLACAVVPWLIEAVLFNLPTVRLGVQLNLEDIAMLILAIVAIARLVKRGTRDKLMWIWHAFGILALSLLALGLQRYRTSAGLEFKPFLFLWTIVTYTASFKLTSAESTRIQRLLLLTAGSLLVIYLWRLIAYFADAQDQAVILALGSNPLKSLPASQAQFLGLCALLLAFRWARGTANSLHIWAALVMLAAVVLLQHRSVWAATATGVLLIPTAVRTTAVPSQSVKVTLATAIVIALVVAFVISTESGHQIMAQTASSAFSESGTFFWRVNGWRELVGDWSRGGLAVNMFGYPFGQGWTRYIEHYSHSLTVSPHSLYVTVLLRGGLVGLALLAIFIALIVRRLWPGASELDRRELPGRGIVLLIAAQAVYTIAYSSHHVQAIFIGIAASLAVRARQERAPHHDHHRAPLSGQSSQ